MPALLFIILIIGVICTAIPAYNSYGRNKKNQKEAIKKTVLITICGTVATLTLAIVANFIYDGIKTKVDHNTDLNSSSIESNSNNGNPDIITHITVSLDANEGSVDISEFKVEYKGNYPALPSPQREHFTFKGWYTEFDGGRLITDYSIVEVPYDHTIYARWERCDDKVPNVVGMPYDEAKVTLENCGFKVKKNELAHSTEPINQVTYQSVGFGEYLPIGSSIELSVSNGRKQVTVYLNPNYENALPDTIIVEYEGKYPKLPILERWGYVFEGWYTKTIGGDLITNDITVNEKMDHSLYAHWKETAYGKRNIPVAFGFENCISSATLDGSNLAIAVNKEADLFSNIKQNEVFEWGIQLTSSLGEYRMGDLFLEIKTTMDDDYTIRNSELDLLIVTGEYSVERKEILKNYITTTFDGQYFNIKCDISNEYISLDEMCIKTVVYYFTV